MRRFVVSLVLAVLAPSGCSGSTKPAPEPTGAQSPNSASAFEQGVDAIEGSAWREALSRFDEVLSKDRNNAEATYYRGVALEKLGRLDDASEAYLAALKLDEKLAAVRINLAALYLEAKPPKAKEAIALLESVAKTATDSMVHENIAYAHSVLGNATKAEEHYRAALALDDNPRIRYALADVLFDAGKQKQSAEHYQKAWSGFLGDLDNLVRIAHRLGKTRSYEDCVKAFSAAIELKDSEAGFHLHRGLCRHGLKQLAEEKADYEAALKVDDTFAPAWFYLGMSVKKTDVVQAKKAFQKAVEHGGSSVVAKRAKQQLSKL